jgi:hypothetical protein
MVPAKRNSWKSTLEKKENGKEFLFFCRNLEVIPQDSWNWKAKKRNAKRNVQPSLFNLSTVFEVCDDGRGNLAISKLLAKKKLYLFCDLHNPK